MYNEKIVCAYLYIISKYGYPPPAEFNSIITLMKCPILDLKAIELEGIREEHLQKVYRYKGYDKRKNSMRNNLKVTLFLRGSCQD